MTTNSVWLHSQHLEQLCHLSQSQQWVLAEDFSSLEGEPHPSLRKQEESRCFAAGTCHKAIKECCNSLLRPRICTVPALWETVVPAGKNSESPSGPEIVLPQAHWLREQRRPCQFSFHQPRITGMQQNQELQPNPNKVIQGIDPLNKQNSHGFQIGGQSFLKMDLEHSTFQSNGSQTQNESLFSQHTVERLLPEGHINSIYPLLLKFQPQTKV